MRRCIGTDDQVTPRTYSILSRYVCPSGGSPGAKGRAGWKSQISNLKSGPSCSPRCCPSLPTLPSPRLAPLLRQRRRLAQIGLGLRAWSEHHSLLMPSPLVSQSGGSRVVCPSADRGTVCSFAWSFRATHLPSGPFFASSWDRSQDPKKGSSVCGGQLILRVRVCLAVYDGRRTSSYTAGGHQSVGSSFVCHV